MPDYRNPASPAPGALRTDAYVSLWMLPFGIAQTMMEAGATMMGVALDRTRNLTEQQFERGRRQTRDIVAGAEEQLGKLDDGRGDTAVNPAALVS